MPKTLENQICIAITPMGLVIGRISEQELSDPRLMVINKSEKGKQIIIQFQKIISEPSLFFLGACASFISENEDINNAYTEDISGIEVVEVIPEK